VNVTIGDGTTLKGIATGEVLLQGKERIRLKEVLHVPELATNLLSGTRVLENTGLRMECDQSGITIQKQTNKAAVLRADLGHGGLIVCAEIIRKESAVPAATGNDSEDKTPKAVEADIWHKRLGHIGGRMLKVTEMKVKGMRLKGILKETCVPCIQGKMKHAKSVSSRNEKASRPGEKLHVDPTGKMPVESVGGKKSALLITDDFSGYRWAYLARKKSEYDELLIQHIEKLKKMEKPVSNVVMDNEIATSKMQDYASRKSIELILSAPYEPRQNGRAERTVGIVKDVTRTNLISSGLSQSFWGEALMTSIYQLNRRSTSSNQNQNTPFELFYNETPDVSNMRIFGSTAYVYSPNEKRKAWTPKSTKMRFVGYQENSKNYRFINNHGAITRSPTAIFLEEDILKQNKRIQNESEASDELEHKGQSSGSSESDEEENVEPQRPRRSARRRTQVDFWPLVPYQEVGAYRASTDIPANAEEALKDAGWRAAMDDEFMSLIGRGTWEVVDRPKNRKVISSKWVFALKRDESGVVVRKKARFVARGFSQVPGVDYGESYAPVVEPAVLRLCMAYAAKLGKKMRMIDFKCAFLNGILMEIIYLEQPKGYEEGDPETKVLLLKKAIYGLVQSALRWYLRFASEAKKMGFKPLKTDPATFIRESDGVILNTHVDDVNCIGDEEALLEIEESLEKTFELRRLGETKFLIGMKVETNEDDGSVMLSQTAYIDDLLERFNLGHMNASLTPMAEGQRLTKSTEETCATSFRRLYQEKVGSLQYLVKMTRPDIAYATKEVSKHCRNPGAAHMRAVNKLFAYLKHTRTYGLKLRVNGELQIRNFADADFAGCVDTRRSTCGFVVMLGEAPIQWKSREQRSVSVSTLEAECYSLSTSLSDALWLRDVLREISAQVVKKILCYEDNEACVTLSKSLGIGKAKHIATRFHFVKELVANGDIDVHSVSSEEMVADSLTKPFTRTKAKVVQQQLSIQVK
jgi:transposase InsO family protein